MIIRPGSDKHIQAIYADGSFNVDDAFVISKLGGDTPFGGTLCSIGTDYAVQLAPDGTGRSMFAGLDITPSSGVGKAWYVKDTETGEVWTPFFSPLGESCDGYSVSYLPGQVTVRCIKNKIAAEITIGISPDRPYEIWRVKLENYSAQVRMLTFTTYIEVSHGISLEAKYMEQQKTLVMRRSLDSISEQSAGAAERELVMFHSSTLAPTVYQTEKSTFIGEGKTLRNPQHLSGECRPGSDGPVCEAIAALTVEIPLPIDGSAEFGFTFGIADSLDEALFTGTELSRIDTMNDALDRNHSHWELMCSSLKVNTQDKVFDALVNTWLPYEAYASWIGQRTGGVCLDPSRVADSLRRMHSLLPSAPHICRESLLSFAAGVSANKTYSSNSESVVTLIPSELLWLAATTAAYVAETGDITVLDEKIALRDGPVLTLKDHCERAIGICLQSDAATQDPCVRRLQLRTLELWSSIGDENGVCPSDTMQKAMRELTRISEQSEQMAMPRRLKYLQSISPTLADPHIVNLLNVTSASEIGTLCDLYSIITEDILGVRTTFQGLTLRPNIPDLWDQCSITRRFRGDTYNINIKRAVSPSKQGITIVADGEPVLGEMLPYSGGGVQHTVDVIV